MRLLKYPVLFAFILTILFSCSPKTTEVDKCAAPVFNPPGGTYTAAQSVTITCSTNDAAILYTTDGSEPAYSSAEYINPIIVPVNKTIKAKAVKSGFKDSQTVTSVYDIYDRMAYVPGGTFSMGRTSGIGNSNELPVHDVAISPFYIGKYEVKQSEWLDIMGSNPSNFTGDLNRPVERINWYSALVYCNKRSIAEGLVPVYSINSSTNPDNWGAVPMSSANPTWDAAVCDWTVNGYRMPTEAEWEYAARGAQNTPDYLYSGNNDISIVAWFGGNAGGRTQPVGTKLENGLGIFDMSGNVNEWCWDWFNTDYYTYSPVNNPAGPSFGSLRVLRGGCWNYPSENCRLAYRNSIVPNYYSMYYGLRLVRSIVN